MATGGEVSRREQGVARRSRKGLRGRVGGAIVPAALLLSAGGLVVGGGDSRTVFGSSVVQVRADQLEVSVSTLFGSTTVVVPDDVSVDTGGFMVFGSTDCVEACRAGRTRTVSVRALGGFGSVEVKTQSEHDRDRASSGD